MAETWWTARTERACMLFEQFASIATAGPAQLLDSTTRGGASLVTLPGYRFAIGIV